jgi:hypothetical protein
MSELKFCPAVYFEWLKQVYSMVEKVDGNITSSLTLVLFIIHMEATIDKETNGLRISHSDMRLFKMDRQTMNRALIVLEKAGVIKTRKVCGKSPLIDLLVKPIVYKSTKNIGMSKLTSVVDDLL